jgi:hypothetical protein
LLLLLTQQDVEAMLWWTLPSHQLNAVEPRVNIRSVVLGACSSGHTKPTDHWTAGFGSGFLHAAVAG